MSQTRFDKALIRYQKFSLLPLIISLASFFASLVYHLASKQGSFLMLYFLTYCYFDVALFFVLSGLLILVGLGATLFAAKGRVIYLIIFASFYFLDFISIFFSSFTGNESNYVASILIHIVVLILLGLGIFFYCLAKKELIEEKKKLK